MRVARIATLAVLAGLGFTHVAMAGIMVPPTRVPEPASLGLLAAGIAGVAWVKFRTRK